MRVFRVAVALLVLLVAGCNPAGYRQDATHRPTSASSGVPEASTGPTADPSAHPSGLPRAVVSMGRHWGGDLPSLGIVAGVILLGALALGVYTVVAARRTPPEG